MQRKSFFVHAELIAVASKPLERLIKIGMLEAQSGQAVLKVEDEATFARFRHWAYTGFYHAEVFSERPKRETRTVEVDEVADDGIFRLNQSTTAGLPFNSTACPAESSPCEENQKVWNCIYEPCLGGAGQSSIQKGSAEIGLPRPAVLQAGRRALDMGSSCKYRSHRRLHGHIFIPRKIIRIR